MVGLPVKYTDFYGQAIPNDPISLVSDIPKNELIATIAAVNTRLKPIISSSFDISIKTQIDCLRVVLLDNNNSPQNSLARPWIERYATFSKNSMLFTRVACLYAFQSIRSSSGLKQQSPDNYTLDQRENIFKFLLIANEKSIAFDKEFQKNGVEELGEDFYDFFMFKQIPFNQYYSSFNPINKFYAGWYLFKTLYEDEFFKEHICKYLQENFELEDVTEFFKYVFGQYFQSNDDNLKLSYLKVSSEHRQAIKILKKLSEDHKLGLPNEDNPLILDFLQLKKSPVYWDGTVSGDGIYTFIILDGLLFIEKIYSLFINDFWFDYLKKNNICGRDDWGNFVGDKFFEPFVNEIFSRIYEENKRVKYLSFSDLIIDIPGKSNIEFADFYVRDRNEVIVIEAKSQYVPNIAGFKNVNTLDDFIKLKHDKFYKDYGLEQLLEKAVKSIDYAKSQLPDIELRKKGKIHLYPTLILNDPIISFGPSNLAFRMRFERMLKDEGILTNSEELRIMPLSIINIMELMDMEESLKARRQTLTNYLRMQFSSVNGVNAKNAFDLAKPFSWVINARIPHKFRISSSIQSFNWLGFNRKIKRKDK